MLPIVGKLEETTPNANKVSWDKYNQLTAPLSYIIMRQRIAGLPSIFSSTIAGKI